MISRTIGGSRDAVNSRFADLIGSETESCPLSSRDTVVHWSAHELRLIEDGLLPSLGFPSFSCFSHVNAGLRNHWLSAKSMLMQ